MISLILVDDQKIVREGIKILLSLDEEIKIIGEAENGVQLLELLRTEKPEVILMDIRMPLMDGVEATKIVKEKYKEIKIIILTTFDDDEFIFNGLRNGADGYILKDAGSEDIIKAIKTAYAGNILLNPEIATKLVKAFNSIADNKNDTSDENKQKLCLLTPRELEVAKLIGEGKTNRDICRNLFLTEGTVKNYVTKILEKLQLNSRTELAIFIKNC